MNVQFGQLRAILFTFFLLCGGAVVMAAEWQQPPQMLNPTFGNGNLQDFATDKNGHSISVFRDNGTLYSTYYSNGVWTTQVIAPNIGFVNLIRVAMDATGTAVVIWTEDTTALRSARFSGGVWTVLSPDPLFVSTGTITAIAVDMNGSGQAVASWLEYETTLTVGQVLSSFFNGATWGTIAPSIPGPLSFDVVPYLEVAYSQNGTAVTAYSDGATVVASTAIGQVWQAPLLLGTAQQFEPIDLGVDATGHAIAIFLDAANNVIATRLNAGVWTPTILSTPGANSGVSIGVAPGGTAVATWLNGSDGFSSSFNGTTWEAPLIFATGIGPFAPDVSVDDSGNALVIYGIGNAIFSQDLFSAQLPIGGVWGTYLTVYTNLQEFSNVNPVFSGLQNNGNAFAVWQQTFGEGESNVFGTVLIAAIGPLDALGTVCNNKFASQTDRVHIITWVPSDDPAIIAYYLRRNGLLIAAIPASGPFIYSDHNRCRRVEDTYVLTAVTAAGFESDATVLILR